MSSPLVTITSDSPFWVGANLMNSRKIRRLVVIDDEQVVGIITITDLVDHFIRHVKSEPN